MPVDCTDTELASEPSSEPPATLGTGLSFGSLFESTEREPSETTEAWRPPPPPEIESCRLR